MNIKRTLALLSILSLVFATVIVMVSSTAKPAYAADDGTKPATPVKLVFAHHSVGENWLSDDQGGLGRTLNANNYFVSDTNYGWGPNSIGDRTDIPNWLEWFRSSNTAQYMTALYGQNTQNSSYTRTLANPGGANTIIMFKSCFPNSSLSGNPNDPPTAGTDLTVGNAKYVYNELLQYFGSRPDKLFVVITAPPNSETQYATNARAFNEWLRTRWLTDNHYTLKNVAVYDFYNVLTGPNNHHRLVNGVEQHVYTPGMNSAYYRSGEGDDHPNVAGSVKARNEFVPMLNAFYHRWLASDRTPHTTTLRLAVVPSQDGWTVESRQGSNVGGGANNTSPTIPVGDTVNNQQYRGIIAFNTARIPAQARIVSATVRVKLVGISGVSPFTTHGRLVADIRKPWFGISPALSREDFQSVPSRATVGVGVAKANNYYDIPLSTSANQWINYSGTTQLKLRFQTSTDRDRRVDAAIFASGESPIAANRPVLEVVYSMP